MHRRGDPLLPLVQSAPLEAGERDGPPSPQCCSDDLDGQFGSDITCVTDTQLENADLSEGKSERVGVMMDAGRNMAPPDLPPKQRPAALHTETFLRLERPPSLDTTPRFKYIKPEAPKLDLKGRSKDAQAEHPAPSQTPLLARSDKIVAVTHVNVSNSDISHGSQAARAQRDTLQAHGCGPARRNLTAENAYNTLSFGLEATSNSRGADTLEHPPPYNSRQRKRSKNNKHKGAGPQGNIELNPSQSLIGHLQDTQSNGPSSRVRQQDANSPLSHHAHTGGDEERVSETAQKSPALLPEVTVIPDDDDVVIVSYNGILASTAQNMDRGNGGGRGSANGTKGHPISQEQPPVIQNIDVTREDNTVPGSSHLSNQDRGLALQAHRALQRRAASIAPLPSESSDVARPISQHRAMSGSNGIGPAASHIRVIPTLKRQSSCGLRVQKGQSKRNIPEPSDTPGDTQVLNMTTMGVLGLATGLAQQDEEELEAKEAGIRTRQAKINSLTNSMKQLCAETKSLQYENQEQRAQLELATKSLKKYQIKYSGLRKFLEGLANDRNALKKEHQVLTQRFEEIMNNRNELDSLRKEIEQSAENLANRIRALGDLERFSNEAKHEIVQLQKTVEILRRELDEKSGLLAAERDRTLRLETDCGANNQRHEELKKLLSSGQRSIVEFQQQHQEQLDQYIYLINELRENENLKPESLTKICDLITSFSNRVSESLSVADQMHCENAKAGKEREQLLRDEITVLKADAMSLEQQKLSLGESNATTMEKLHCSDEKVLELRKETASMRSESRALNETISALQREVAHLSALPQVNPQTLAQLQEMKNVNEELRAKIEEESSKTLTHKEDARQAIDKLTLALEEAQGLRSRVAAFDQERAEYEQQVKQTLENDRIFLEQAAASVRQRELRRFENSIQQLTNAKNKAEEKAALSERQKQLTGESFFALEDKVETLKKSEEIATQSASRMRDEMTLQAVKIASQQEQIHRLEQLNQELASRATEAECRLAESERRKDAAEAGVLERKHIITELEQTCEMEIDIKSQLENTLRRCYLLCPDEQFTPAAFERVISGLIGQNTQLRPRSGTPPEIMVCEGLGTRRAASQKYFDNPSSSPTREVETKGNPLIEKIGTAKSNAKTSSAVYSQPRSERQPLAEESFSIPETQLSESPMVSFSRINRSGKPNRHDSGSDSGLSDAPDTPPSENALGNGLQKSNISKTKQKSPKEASKLAVVVQNLKLDQAINYSSSQVVTRTPTRTYSAKRQRSENSGAVKGHGKKRAKLNDTSLATLDSQNSNPQRSPSLRRQSGKIYPLFLVGLQLRAGF